MAVYMLQAETSRHVKIGKTDVLGNRFRSLQGACWEPLTLIRLLEGGFREEGALHLRFQGLRIRAEWFRFDEVMLGDVGLRDITEDEMVDPFGLSEVDARARGLNRRIWKQAVRMAWLRSGVDTMTVYNEIMRLHDVG